MVLKGGLLNWARQPIEFQRKRIDFASASNEFLTGGLLNLARPSIDLQRKRIGFARAANELLKRGRKYIEFGNAVHFLICHEGSIELPWGSISL